MSEQDALENHRLARPLVDYEDLKERLYLGDPLADVDRPDQVVQQDDGLYIKGYDDEKGSASDLLLTINPDKTLTLRYRDCANEKEPCYGQEWSDPVHCDDYKEAVCFAYEL